MEKDKIKIWDKYDDFTRRIHPAWGSLISPMALGMYFGCLLSMVSIKLTCPNTFQDFFNNNCKKFDKPILETVLQPLTKFSVFNDRAEIFLYYGAPGRQPFIGGITYVDSNKNGDLDFIKKYDRTNLVIKNPNETSLEERSIFEHMQNKYNSLQKQYSNYFTHQ